MMITEKKITEETVELLRRAAVDLPDDVESALRKAYINKKNFLKGNFCVAERLCLSDIYSGETKSLQIHAQSEQGSDSGERNEIARIQLRNILDNIKYARENRIPICQDTGLINFYVGIGSKADVDLKIINNSIKKAVKIATNEIPLRPNTVHPLTRKNSGSNIGINIPNIEIEILPDKNFIGITAFLRGAGSENMSKMVMLKPSDGIREIKKFVIEIVAKSGGMPCPPIIVGVGIGGSSDIAAKLAKRALLRKIGSGNKDEKIARLEKNLLKKINKLGIGPMGLGGRTTALDVHIEIAHCHTGSLPVAVNLGCWANRHKTVRIY